MKRFAVLLLICLLLPVLCIGASASYYTVSGTPSLLESVHQAAQALESDVTIQFGDYEGLLERWQSDPAFAQEIVSNSGIVGCTYTLGVNPMQLHADSYYPGTRILYAIRSGNYALLSSRELDTMHAAQELIESSGARYSADPYRTVLDALVCRVSYDSMTFYSMQLAANLYENDTAIGALLNGQADCDGYADACVLLFSMLGADARYMNVTQLSGIPHMVVQLNLNGRWCIVDPCQEDGGDLALNQYYGLSASQARQFYSWTESLYSGYLF